MSFATTIAQAKWSVSRTAESLSLLSKLGIFLLLGTLLTYFFAYQPLTSKLASLEQSSRQNHSPALAKTAPDASVNQYIAAFPSLTTRASKLNELVEIAKLQELLLNEVTYKTEANVHQPLNRYQVELSILASYPETHRFISAVLEKMPFVAIESLNLNRGNVLDEAVEARIQFTFYFKRT